MMVINAIQNCTKVLMAIIIRCVEILFTDSLVVLLIKGVDWFLIGAKPNFIVQFLIPSAFLIHCWLVCFAR